MATATLAEIIRDIRAEAGHALTPSQGLNTIDTLRRLVQKTEYELWVAFEWPTLIQRANIKTSSGQEIYDYPAEMGFDQIRGAYWSPDGNSWRPMDYGIPENCIDAAGDNSASGSDALYWEDANPDTKFRIWPTPNREGWVRLRGMRTLNTLVDDDDVCTLDSTLLSLLISARLLMRSKAEDAQAQQQAAQRHLQKLLANQVSNKHKVSTFGASRRPISARPRPFLDYIP